MGNNEERAEYHEGMQDTREYAAELAKAEAAYFRANGRGPRGEFPPTPLVWFGETTERVCLELHAMKHNLTALERAWEEQGQEDFYWGDLCEAYEGTLTRMEANVRELHRGLLAGWFDHRQRIASGQPGDTHDKGAVEDLTP